jgi:hypothetical protein
MVVCFVGCSRSATAVVSYLITKKQMTGFDALKQIRQHRDIFPSEEQLGYVARLHNKIHGFKDVDVTDGHTEMTVMRKLALKLRNEHLQSK